MFPIGSIPKIPTHMLKRGMLHFQTKPTTNKKYYDNLCIFRCLAKYLYDDCSAAIELLKQYDSSANPKSFKGAFLKRFC